MDGRGPGSIEDTALWPTEDHVLQGNFVSLTTLRLAHADELWPTVSSPEVVQARWWEYIRTPPFGENDKEAFRSLVRGRIVSTTGAFYAVVDDASKTAVGWICLTSIRLDERDAEVGVFLPSPVMQRTVRVTEAMFLLLRYAFEELGFESLAWRTDEEHKASRRTAERLGFAYLGVEGATSAPDDENTRKTMVYRMCKAPEWAKAKRAIEAWLDPKNFEDGRQVKKLEELKSPRAL